MRLRKVSALFAIKSSLAICSVKTPEGTLDKVKAGTQQENTGGSGKIYSSSHHFRPYPLGLLLSPNLRHGLPEDRLV